MHILTVRSSAIVPAEAAGPDTRTGPQDTHAAAMHVQESSKFMQGDANAVLYKAPHSTPRTPRKSTPHMQLARAIRAHVLPQSNGGGGTDHADRLEPGETILWPHPGSEQPSMLRGPQCGLRGARRPWLRPSKSGRGCWSPGRRSHLSRHPPWFRWPEAAPTSCRALLRWPTSKSAPYRPSPACQAHVATAALTKLRPQAEHCSPCGLSFWERAYTSEARERGHGPWSRAGPALHILPVIGGTLCASYQNQASR